MRTLNRRHLRHLRTLLTFTILTAALTWAQDPIDPTNPGACAGTASPCVPTYHNDTARDGVQPNETALSPATFPQTGANFGLLTPSSSGASGAVDALIYAQPL